tara:strand:+ start:745 stop:1080 length:336 start_codon:yes stop_codon:yes gene_type:complete
MYQIALIELYNEKCHGKTKCSSDNLESNFIVVYTIELEEFYNNEYIVYQMFLNTNKKAVFKDDIDQLFLNTRLEIIESKELNGLEQIAIIKTFWLKVLQRKIKSYLKTIAS